MNGPQGRAPMDTPARASGEAAGQMEFLGKEPAVQKGFTLWLAGVPGADKKTLARLLKTELRERGLRVEVLDADVIRQDLEGSPGLSPADGNDHMPALASACGRLAREGAACILVTPLPSPAAREAARVEIGTLFEVLVAPAPDARPVGVPMRVEFAVQTDRESPEEGARRILRSLEERGYLPRVAGVEATYSEEEEAVVRQRLEDLGYL